MHATNAFYWEQQIRIEKQIYFVAIKVFFMPSAFKTDMYMQRGSKKRWAVGEGEEGWWVLDAKWVG